MKKIKIKKPTVEQLKLLIATTLGVDLNQLVDKAEFEADLNVGPLELRDLIEKIEEKFDIKLEKKEDLINMGDLIKNFEEAVDNIL